MRRLRTDPMPMQLRTALYGLALAGVVFALGAESADGQQAPELLVARSEPLAGIASSSSSSSSSASSSSASLVERAAALPDAPSADPNLVPLSNFAFGFVSASALPCRSAAVESEGPEVDSADATREPCLQAPDAYHRFLNTTTPIPLTPAQKGHLAVRNLVDPGNLATILGTAGFIVGTNAYTAYGPGWKGFGYAAGTIFEQDATGEFFGTFLIPSIAHEDPHYHRMPHASIPRRVVHAISRTVMAQSDTGHLMPNYSCLLTYPITSEIANLYVPGLHTNGPSTVARILTGYATDPVDNLITEFLPDVAKRIHVRVIFVQSILNQVASDQYSLP